MRRSATGWKVTAAGLIMLLASAAQGTPYYLTRVDARAPTSLDPAIKVQTFTRPIALVMVSNTSDRAVRCRLDFSTGRVPAGSDARLIAPHGHWIARSPVAGPVGVIDVDVGCS